MAYPFQSMGRQAVINDAIGGVDIVVVWDRDSNIALPFAREVAGQSLTCDIDKGECTAPGPARPRDRNLKRGRRSSGRSAWRPTAHPGTGPQQLRVRVGTVGQSTDVWQG